jgi:hypothetical protein
MELAMDVTLMHLYFDPPKVIGFTNELASAYNHD